MIPTLSIVFMAITAAVCMALPFVLLVVLKKKGADILPFFIGCGVMLIFAFILESLCSGLISSSPIGETIKENVWLYALFGGLMAGVFEETGRFLAFLFVMKKHRKNDLNSLMYGAGHGGFEAIALVGLAMISNIAISIMINSGMSAQLTEGLTGDTLAQVQTAITTLKETPSYMFLLSLAERLSAITVHISLSVLVWFAVKNRKWFLYPVAILLHMAVDGTLVLMQKQFCFPTWLIEVCIGAMAVALAGFAVLVWKKEKREELPASEEVSMQGDGAMCEDVPADEGDTEE